MLMNVAPDMKQPVISIRAPAWNIGSGSHQRSPAGIWKRSAMPAASSMIAPCVSMHPFGCAVVPDV